jgi:hypothetical protein
MRAEEARPSLPYALRREVVRQDGDVGAALGRGHPVVRQAVVAVVGAEEVAADGAGGVAVAGVVDGEEEGLADAGVARAQ